MNFIDYLILIVLLASVVLGFFRGFLREAIGLLSWLGGLWLAWHFAYLLEPYLGGQLAKAPFNMWAARGILLLGCLVIGFLGGLASSKQLFAESGRLFLFTGILGGFTTFSAFGLETFYLLRTSQWLLAFGNVFIQLFLGISAVALGYWFSKVF